MPPQKSLADFLPALPTPDGTPQSVYAGAITTANAATELIPGPAKSGLPGDFYIRNSKGRFVIQSPARAIGVVPWGGNVVDAVPRNTDGTDDGVDHLGEVSMVYLLGRTCAHDTIEVLLDGAGGGPAVIRATGHAATNDYINLRGIGVLPVSADLDPDIEDDVDCATTYTLYPDSARLEVAWTLYNGGQYNINGPFGALCDTGGMVESFSPPTLGFNRAGVEALLDGGEAQPAPYAVYQGPGVAYGIIPVHEATIPNATFLVAGVSIMIYGADQLLDILEPTAFYLHLAQNDGLTNRLNLVVGNDASDVAADYQQTLSGVSTAVTGQVSGMVAAGARVGVYDDVNGDGALDDDDHIVTYMDVAADGSYTGALPPGAYLLRADQKDVARSAVAPFTVADTPVTAPALVLPDPARFDYTVIDDATGAAVPAKLQVIGRHPAAPDKRVHETYDRRFGVIRVTHAVYGTTVAAAPGDPVDAPLDVPVGGTYRVIASHGPEWSIDSQVITPTSGQTGTLTFHLRRVLDTTGYVSSEFHQHAVGSPDSPVAFDDRLKSLVVEGIEFFASTDHDFLADYDPMIDALGVRDWIDGVVGIEATPFAFGHFIAFPLITDDTDPTNGAVDWAASAMPGFAMLPGELWGELRTRGAEIIQVNHPRALSAFAGFQAYFDRAGLTFDFDTRVFEGAVNDQPVPADWLRLPDATQVFNDQFDTLEVWNGFALSDSDLDGVKEIQSLDIVMRDWLNFLSFGKIIAPMGNSDTHSREKDPAGMPRTMIRVPDDSSAAVAAGVDTDIYATILGSKPRDIVVTDGPMLAVTATGVTGSAIGATFAPTGDAELTITATSAEWIDFDTIELFANSTFDPPDGDDTVLQPLACFTSRTLATLMATDPCQLAPIAPQTMTVQSVTIPGGGGARRWEATVTITLAAADIPKHADAVGDDAWIVVRVRGQKAVYPILVEGAIDDGNIDVLVSGSDVEIDAALRGRGVPATAFTAPIFVDFDGGGWLAQFAP